MDRTKVLTIEMAGLYIFRFFLYGLLFSLLYLLDTNLNVKLDSRKDTK